MISSLAIPFRSAEYFRPWDIRKNWEKCISGNQIKCGYCGWLISGSCANIEQHKCFENYKEDIHLLHVDENHVARIIPRYSNDQNNNSKISTTNVVTPVEDYFKTKSNDNVDEILIELVSQRPVLWNYKLPIQDRTNLKKDALWLEVSNEMGRGNATVQWVKNRWKDLRDAYVKARKKIKAYVPSGCDTATAKKLRKSSFCFYERMQFLEVSLATETTISSLPCESSCILDSSSRSDSICSESIITLMQSTKTSHPSISSKMTLSGPSTPLSLNTALTKANSSTALKNKQKRLNSIEQNDVQEDLLKALCQPLNQPDAVDGILLRLGEGLRRLPYRERSELEIQWLRELVEVEKKCFT